MLSFRNPFVTNTSKKFAEANQKESHGLFVLYPTLEDKVESTSLEADIVAVHGLNGDARKTWTDPESGSFWLEDFLPDRAKTARIMTFGYDSKLAFSKSKAGVETFSRDLLGRLRLLRRSDEKTSRRPLIFVAHSLGGIVVKKALIMAHMEHNNYGDILDSTIGIVFMGTPHRGSDLASWGLIISNLVNAASLGTGINKELLKTLKPDSEMLAGISGQFVHRATPLMIRTFTEQQVERPLTALVVPESSAVIGLRNEIVLPLNANHRSMCRFRSSDSENYKIVEETIMEILSSPKKADIYSSSYSFMSQSDTLMGNVENKVSPISSSVSFHTAPKFAARSFAGRNVDIASRIGSQAPSPIALSVSTFASPQQTHESIARPLEVRSASIESHTVSAVESQSQDYGTLRKLTPSASSASKQNQVVIRVHKLRKKLTPETYGESEFSHSFSLPGDTLVENIGKELIKAIPGLKHYQCFMTHGTKRAYIEETWRDKFTTRVEVTNGRPCANPKKGFKINIDQPIAAFMSRAYPKPLHAQKRTGLPTAVYQAQYLSTMWDANRDNNKHASLDDPQTTGLLDTIALGRDIDDPELAISFMRTARLPWCDEKYQLPPATGSFPLFDVQTYADKMPDLMASQGGIFMPMYQMEAIWIKFTGLGPKQSNKFAVRPFVGGVNTISGQALHCTTMDTILPKKRVLARNQDYFVFPPQHRLDGSLVEPGIVRQFVATEMVSASRKDYLAAKKETSDEKTTEQQTPAGASVEWQVTGNDEFGGLQLQVIPTYDVESMHAGSDENNLYLRGEDLRRYDVLKTPREQGLVAGDFIHVKDLKSVLPMRRKMLSDLVVEFPTTEAQNTQEHQDGSAGREKAMVEIEVDNRQVYLQYFDIRERGDDDNTLRLQFDRNDHFSDIGVVIVSKMGYNNRAGLLFCVWRRKNRKPGIIRVQNWEDVHSGTPRMEPEVKGPEGAEASRIKVWDMITVPIGSLPDSDYICEVARSSRIAWYTESTTPNNFCIIVNSGSTIGQLRSELQSSLGFSIAKTAFTIKGSSGPPEALDDDMAIKTAEPKTRGFGITCDGPDFFGRILFLAGPGIDSRKACTIPRAYKGAHNDVKPAGLTLGLTQCAAQHQQLPQAARYSHRVRCDSFSRLGMADREISFTSLDREEAITVEHEGTSYKVAVPVGFWNSELSFVKVRLLALTGIQPRNQVLRYGGEPLEDTHLVWKLMGKTLNLTTQPPTRPGALGFGAGGKIEQHIELDYENPRVWDIGSSKILNVQLLDSHTFKAVTGLDPPPTPLSPEKYAEMGLAFEKAWRDELKGPGVSGRAEDGTWGGVSSLEGPMEVAARNAGVQIPAAGERDSGDIAVAGVGAGQGGFFEAAADFPVLLQDVDDTVSQFKSAMEVDLEDDWSD